jgi:hypothetical protein
VTKSSTVTAPPDFGINPHELPRLVKPDPHRPGRARWRLTEFERPIWALIQWIQVIGKLDDAAEASEAVIAQVAADYAIEERGVRAALAYYARNRAYIDAFLLLNNDWDSP